MPHVRRVASLAVQGAYKDVLSGGISAGLSATERPVWLVDAAARVYWSNAAARRTNYAPLWPPARNS
jgi:hypothetical protein